MRVLVLGAGGFLGREILSALLADDVDVDVVAVVRRAAGVADAFPKARFIELDLAKALKSSDWEEALRGVDVIVNAAGILQGNTMDAIHVGMPAALHAEARAQGVKRTILISAISARPDVDTDYSRSKLLGEEVVRRSGLGWTILRPSLVYGDGSYGGTSLMRGMAALPWIMPVPGDGQSPFSPIHVRDVARAVRMVCVHDHFNGQTLEPAGPETISLEQLLRRYRLWLGLGHAHILRIPMPVMFALARLGDLARLGPMTTTSLQQLVAGNTGNGAQFAERIGFQPRSLGQALQARPAHVQDRWHARLFFLAPLVRATLVLLWLASAILGLLSAKVATAQFVAALHLPESWADPLRLVTSMLDLLVAAVVLFDQRARWSTPIQVTVIMAYTVTLGIALPGLWVDPLGPLLKNVPILMLVLVHGAIASRR
jgi:uncharacterized protein YbjT (DUF2867 family)